MFSFLVDLFLFRRESPEKQNDIGVGALRQIENKIGSQTLIKSNFRYRLSSRLKVKITFFISSQSSMPENQIH